jgi:hypothetical protein
MPSLTQPHNKLILSMLILSLIYKQCDSLSYCGAINQTNLYRHQSFKYD